MIGKHFSKGVFSSNIFFIRFIRHSSTTTPEFDNHPCMCHLPYFNDFNLFFCTLKIDVDLCSEHNRTAILFSNHFYIFGHWVDLHLYDCMHDSYTTTFVVQKATKNLSARLSRAYDSYLAGGRVVRVLVRSFSHLLNMF